MYVEDDSGNRVCCGHPGEHFAVASVLGISYEQAQDALVFTESAQKWWWLPSRRKAFRDMVQFVKSRTGVGRDAVCCTCLSQFRIDLEKDARVCPNCGASDVYTVTEMLGRECPSCKRGVIKSIDTGVVS